MRRLLSAAGIVGLVFIVPGVRGAGYAAAAPKRFADNGNGTITDKQTGRVWEKKLAADDVGGNCADASQGNRSLQCVNNEYSWSSANFGSDPDGTLFTDFLAKMNCVNSPDGTCGLSLAGFTDWRTPTIAELRSILTDESPNCLAAPCIDPIFGPTASAFTWSSSSLSSNAAAAWLVHFGTGSTTADYKSYPHFVRAVRGGS